MYPSLRGGGGGMRGGGRRQGGGGEREGGNGVYLYPLACVFVCVYVYVCRPGLHFCHRPSGKERGGALLGSPTRLDLW